VASIRNCEKLPPCLIELMPAGFKTDPLLATAKPISNCCSASVITCLRRGKSCCGTAIKRKEGGNVRETTLQTPKSLQKEGEEVLETPEQGVFPCSS